MARITYSLGFILFCLIPYVVITAAIWGVGCNVKSPQKDFW